jgi:hypothetical protein
MMNEEPAAVIAPAIPAAGGMSLRVAGLGLRLEMDGAQLCLAPPAGHLKFLELQSSTAEAPAVPDNLLLHLRNISLPLDGATRSLLCRTEIWEMWLDEVGRYIFTAPREVPPRWVVLDPGFVTGEVIGDFSSSDEAGRYPLQGLDNVLFVNWLGIYGDLSLHASGVVVDGKGYAFIGPAGAGKSTLAAYLSACHAAQVLGEDQIFLRYLDGRFWIFGTPWHENPAMCSPDGVPLEKLFFLDRDARPGVERLTPGDGIARILQTAFIPYYRPKLVSSILDRLVLLAEQMPFHSLSYQLGEDVWELICSA